MKGYLPHAVVKAVVFWVLTLCIVCVTAAAIMMAWESVTMETGYNFIRTATALGLGALAFLFVNLAFGSLFAHLFEPRLSPPIDPAFGERLHRARESGRLETEPQRKAE